MLIAVRQAVKKIRPSKYFASSCKNRAFPVHVIFQPENSDANSMARSAACLRAQESALLRFVVLFPAFLRYERVRKAGIFL